MTQPLISTCTAVVQGLKDENDRLGNALAAAEENQFLYAVIVVCVIFIGWLILSAIRGPVTNEAGLTVPHGGTEYHFASAGFICPQCKKPGGQTFDECMEHLDSHSEIRVSQE